MPNLNMFKGDFKLSKKITKNLQQAKSFSLARIRFKFPRYKQKNNRH